MHSPKKVSKAAINEALQEWRAAKAQTRQMKALTKKQALRLVYLESEEITFEGPIEQAGDNRSGAASRKAGSA